MTWLSKLVSGRLRRETGQNASQEKDLGHVESMQSQAPASSKKLKRAATQPHLAPGLNVQMPPIAAVVPWTLALKLNPFDVQVGLLLTLGRPIGPDSVK